MGPFAPEPSRSAGRLGPELSSTEHHGMRRSFPTRQKSSFPPPGVYPVAFGCRLFHCLPSCTERLKSTLKAAQKKPGEFVFTSQRRPEQGITTRQYARLVSEWIAGIGLDVNVFGTHSLRRTKATLIYRRTSNLRAVQLLLGHTKIESTVRYLGIEVDDALAIAE